MFSTACARKPGTWEIRQWGISALLRVSESPEWWWGLQRSRPGFSGRRVPRLRLEGHYPDVSLSPSRASMVDV